jgi:hypothetical protein
MYAINFTQTKVAALLKGGASVHAMDAGQTPLHRCLMVL